MISATIVGAYNSREMQHVAPAQAFALVIAGTVLGRVRPNPSHREACPGKPGQASHVKR